MYFFKIKWNQHYKEEPVPPWPEHRMVWVSLELAVLCMGRTTSGPLCAQSPGWALLRDPGLGCRTWHPNLKTVRFLPPFKHLSNSWLVTCWGTPITRVCFSGNKMNWSVNTCPTCSHLVNKAVLGKLEWMGRGGFPDADSLWQLEENLVVSW